MSDRQIPSIANRYRQDQAILLCDSFYRLTGRKLIDAPEESVGEALFFAPFAVVSHDTATDPIFNYANQTALALFEMNWEQFTALPSRHSAEQLQQEARERLLHQVTTQGYIDDYTGIRISRTGKRFFIQRATVWNLDRQGIACGQAAMFKEWSPVQ
ncbi:MEKHLA domain-containing protein [Sedimenticola sp.]|uniref:MEKHLA domain-containing protein n=1 Tax=Sedimenticola sp. TaxID=1940285 RepID=UPI003D0AA4FF